MEIDWFLILAKGIFGGLGAIGFSILFNVPQRTLLPIFFAGLVAMIFKNILIEYFGVNLVLTAFICATIIGVMSSLASLRKMSPAMVFAIPAVIPMIPGVFIYKFMMGIISLSANIGPNYDEIFSQTMNFGLKSIFILISLAIGVSLPTILLRKDSFYEGTNKRSIWTIFREKIYKHLPKNIREQSEG